LVVTEASAKRKLFPDEISFLGIWCVPMIVENKNLVKINHMNLQNEQQENNKEAFVDQAEVNIV